MLESGRIASADEREKSRRALPLAVTAVVLGSLVLVAGVAYVLAANQIGYWQVWQRPGSITGQQWFEHIRSAATLVGVPTIGSALVFSYFRQKSTDRSLTLAEKQIALTSGQLQLTSKQLEQALVKDEREHLNSLRDRFSEAMLNLSDGDELRRSGGISTMISVASDFQSLKDTAGRQDCIDALHQLLIRLVTNSDDLPAARSLWKSLTARLRASNSGGTTWWDADMDLTNISEPLGPILGWIVTGGSKKVNAAMISSGSTSVVQDTNLAGGYLSIQITHVDRPLRFINDELESGTLALDFKELASGGYVSFEDCRFGDIRLVINERMTPAPKRVLRFFRCSFWGSSIILPDDPRSYSLEFSQCLFNDVPLLTPLPEGCQPAIDLWDRNNFSGKVEGYHSNPADASDFDRWSRKSSPYSSEARDR